MNGIDCRTGVIVFTLSDLTRQVGTVVASHADILSARHELLLDELVRQKHDLALYEAFLPFVVY